MPGEIDYEVIPDSDDELNFLTPKTSTAVASGATTPTLHDSETPTLQRTSKKDSSLATVHSTESLMLRLRKRKRTEDEGVASTKRALKPAKIVAKKAKLEDKKAHTIVINSKKVSIEAARRRWLYRHRDIFTPLLPTNNSFFDTLIDDISNSVDRGRYKPLESFTTQPDLIKGGTLKDYQLRGLSFLVWMYENGMNSILGDEMGLGKTLQTISLFAYIKGSTKGDLDPHLVICPLSVVETWMKELAHWAPSFKVLRFHAQGSERARLKNILRGSDALSGYDVCVTTYDIYSSEESWFKSRRWTYVVLDEGHKIKNSDTQIAGKVQGLGALYRLILTGTPVQNNLLELWSLLHFLYPAIFIPTTQRIFVQSFNLERGTYSLPILGAVEKLLNVIMLRRTKGSVDIAKQVEVPPRDELTVFLPLTEVQRFWTYRLLTRLDEDDLRGIFNENGVGAMGKSEDADHDTKSGNLFKKEEVTNASVPSETVHHGSGASTSQWKRLMNLLMQLRQICDHPYLLADVEPSPFVNGEHVITSSSKLVFLDKLLAQILPRGDKVLIFSQWTSMLDLLEDFMSLRSISYARLDGSTPRPRRTLDIRLFQQDKSPYQVFLISTKAGGLGINLTKANTVVMFDSDWNPQNDLQAIARAHRIGQTQTVKVYRLICQGSVEDQMLDRLRRKLFLSLKVINANGSVADTDDDSNTSMKKHELMTILRNGSSAISGAGPGMTLPQFLDSSIDAIIAQSRTRDNTRLAKLKTETACKTEEMDSDVLVSAQEEEAQLLQGVAQVQSRLFEGRIVNRVVSKSNGEIAAEWQTLQKRTRKNRVVTVDGFEVLVEYLGPRASNETPKAQKTRRKQKFEWEDWCVYCRDGGELILCGHCPRVLHAECHGLKKGDVKRLNFMNCPQHECCECHRGTNDAGGMLFRCRTCPRAFCEDCLPPGDIDAIGDAIPEFLVLGFEETPSAYYINCHYCHEQFEADPLYREQWEGEFREAEEKLAAL